VLDTCREIGATFVAFSPLARGFLTGALPDVETLEARDIRRAMPRFSPGNNAANVELLADYGVLARAASCSMAQLALAWLLTRGSHVVAIPGTTSTAHLKENMRAGELALSPDMVARLDSLINRQSIVGERYNAATQAEVDTEEFS
jgi:aryl-alcohol dehydrogenase-like predicted oxidoreductase